MGLRDYFNRILCMKDGGEAHLPGYRPQPLTQGPFSSSFWNAAGRGIAGTVAPMVAEAQQFNQDYPVAGQVAQLVNQPLNVAVGLHGIGEAIKDRDLGAGVASTLGMAPLAGRYAKAAVLAGTTRSLRQAQAVTQTGMRPSAGMAVTAARRVSGDAGALIQTGQLGGATYDQTRRLRDGTP